MHPAKMAGQMAKSIAFEQDESLRVAQDALRPSRSMLPGLAPPPLTHQVLRVRADLLHLGGPAPARGWPAPAAEVQQERSDLRTTALLQRLRTPRPAGGGLLI